MGKVSDLVSKLTHYNAEYRKGTPVVSDPEYDSLVDELRLLDPFNKYLGVVEPENFKRPKIRHKSPMLSTEKAYTKKELKKFIDRIQSAANLLGIANVLYRVTAKLDGLACSDTGTYLVTRGDGYNGYDISDALDKGLVHKGNTRSACVGEIVIDQRYFEENLSKEFEHPRNVCVGAVVSSEANELIQKALEENAIHLVPYSTLKNRVYTGPALLDNLDDIKEEIYEDTPYAVDGVVVDVVSPLLQKHMGATSHHHRWQIAVKDKGETGRTVVESLTWQLGRTGSMTPVAEIKPIKLSGATISRVTAHNAGHVFKKGISPGAEIVVIRSGEVIPKIIDVLKEGEEIEPPEACPVCGTKLIWMGDFLNCPGSECIGKCARRIEHWFKTMGNADGFGTETINTLVNAGIINVAMVYKLTQQDFINLGLGERQSFNLISSLNVSRTEPIEDWKFLASFGIKSLGRGDSRKILKVYDLKEVPRLKYDDLLKLKGFAEKTSKIVIDGIQEIKDLFDEMIEMGFNIRYTSKEKVVTNNYFSDQHIVITGGFKRGKRGAIEALARDKGCIIQSNVNGNTDYLVCGDGVGKKKLDLAEKYAVKIITEDQFFEKLLD